MFCLFSLSLQEQMKKNRIAYIDAMRDLSHHQPNHPPQSLPRQISFWGENVSKPVMIIPDSGHFYAQRVQTCLSFRAYLCTGFRNLPQIQGTFMHRVHKPASGSGHIYAWGA